MPCNVPGAKSGAARYPGCPGNSSRCRRPGFLGANLGIRLVTGTPLSPDAGDFQDLSSVGGQPGRVGTGQLRRDLTRKPRPLPTITNPKREAQVDVTGSCSPFPCAPPHTRATSRPHPHQAPGVPAICFGLGQTAISGAASPLFDLPVSFALDVARSRLPRFFPSSFSPPEPVRIRPRRRRRRRVPRLSPEQLHGDLASPNAVSYL